MLLRKESIARFGLGAIGAVYVLVGILTALEAQHLGGQKTGTKGALGYLANQPLGKILLIIMALGLFSYAFWRMYQTFMDSRKLGIDMNGLLIRDGYFTGGLFYGFLGFVALKLFFGGNYNTQQELIIRILNSKYGSWFGVVFGLILLGKAVFEFYFVISNKFKTNVQSSEMGPKVKSTLLTFGAIGHLARGVVFGIMAFLTIRAGVTLRNDELSTLNDAFQFLNYKFGSLILSIVAVGLFCYGVYMFIKVRYLYIQMH